QQSRTPPPVLPMPVESNAETDLREDSRNTARHPPLMRPLPDTPAAVPTLQPRTERAAGYRRHSCRATPARPTAAQTGSRRIPPAIPLRSPADRQTTWRYLPARTPGEL